MGKEEKRTTKTKTKTKKQRGQGLSKAPDGKYLGREVQLCRAVLRKDQVRGGELDEVRLTAGCDGDVRRG